MDVFSESFTFFFFFSFFEKQLISNVLLGKSTNYVFNSDIVLDCWVYEKAVPMYQCLHVTTF